MISSISFSKGGMTIFLCFCIIWFYNYSKTLFFSVFRTSRKAMTSIGFTRLQCILSNLDLIYLSTWISLPLECNQRPSIHFRLDSSSCWVFEGNSYSSPKWIVPFVPVAFRYFVSSPKIGRFFLDWLLCPRTWFPST